MRPGPSHRKARGEGTHAVEPGHGAGRKAARWEFWPRPPPRPLEMVDLPHQRARGTPPACRAHYGQKLRGCSTHLNSGVCPQPSQAGTATQLALQTRRQGPRDASRRTRQSQPSRVAGPKPTSPNHTQSTFPIDGVLSRTISSLLWSHQRPTGRSHAPLGSTRPSADQRGSRELGPELKCTVDQPWGPEGPRFSGLNLPSMHQDMTHGLKSTLWSQWPGMNPRSAPSWWWCQAI